MSKFSEESVRRRVFDQHLTEGRAKFANVHSNDLQALIDEATQSIKKEMRQELSGNGDVAMNDAPLEIIRGSGNVFADFGHQNAGLEQARAIIAAKIIGILDDRKLSTHDAEKQTGVSHTEFSRIRNTQLRHLTLDRMIVILGKLDEDIEVNISLQNKVE